MKTIADNIEYWKKDFQRIVNSHGLASDLAAEAFFRLQAARMKLPKGEFLKWANGESKRLEEKIKNPS